MSHKRFLTDWFDCLLDAEERKPTLKSQGAIFQRAAISMLSRGWHIDSAEGKVQHEIKNIEGEITVIKKEEELMKVRTKLEMAEQAFEELKKGLKNGAPIFKVISMAAVIYYVTKFYGLKEEELKGPKLHARLVVARVMFAHLARKYVDRSTLADIGQTLNRDHTCTSNYLNRFNDFMKNESDKKAYELIEKELLKIKGKLWTTLK